MADAGVAVPLANYRVDLGATDFTLAEATFVELPDGIVVGDGTLTASAAGIYDLIASRGVNAFSFKLFVKEPEAPAYLVFADAFDGLANGALPSGYTIQTGTASINGERLRLDGIATTPTRVLLPAYLGVFRDYVIETDFTILSVKEPTRWASVMFRYGDAGYYQMAIRQNAMAANGVEFAKWINNGWNVPMTTSHTETIASSKTYHLTIEVRGDQVKASYRNGVLPSEVCFCRAARVG